jgi:hypothetical protein
MRSLKGVIIGIAVFVMIISLSGLAFAEMGQGACKGCKGGKAYKETCVAQIKTLKDSATALQTSNPVLAKGLNDLADKRAEMMQKMQEWKDKHDAKIKLLKDSATALTTSNPALAQELQKMSEKKSMEKEEVGENTESMEGQGEAK